MKHHVFLSPPVGPRDENQRKSTAINATKTTKINVKHNAEKICFDVKKCSKNIKTSLFYKDFSLVKNKLSLDNPDTYVYLIAKKLNIEKEMLTLIPMINLLKDNIDKIGRIYKINKFKSNSD